MCGILFYKSSVEIDDLTFRRALDKQIWRGPDASGTLRARDGIMIGHVRLSIQDLSPAADQPMNSDNGRYCIIFNGEIYNHKNLRKILLLKCKTSSDTETILEGFSAVGEKIFPMLDGMFSIVIVDKNTGDWWAARDRFGIKPLYILKTNNKTIISSETISIRSIVECSVSEQSISEWKIIRRPLPGFTFFNEISEVIPGTIYFNGNISSRIKRREYDVNPEEFNQHKIENLIKKSIRNHELSDVENVCLLSGGIDSTIIAAISSVKKAYTVGNQDNNEFKEAQLTAEFLKMDLIEVNVHPDDLRNSWEFLIRLRGEPLSVPNEGLIYLACAAMGSKEKVVLTGEGADEIFFGYDNIFRSAIENTTAISTADFLKTYGYASVSCNTERLFDYIDELRGSKSNIAFLEDFFLDVHLPGLLRRMDGASMAASKEARVPFVTMDILSYMYRQPPSEKINRYFSKIPLRNILESFNIQGPLQRKKIGFSSTATKSMSRIDEYEFFRSFNLDVLGW